MQSRPGLIGFQGLYAELEDEYDDEVPVHDASGRVLVFRRDTFLDRTVHATKKWSVRSFP
jgi:hypothetical protein